LKFIPKFYSNPQIKPRRLTGFEVTGLIGKSEIMYLKKLKQKGV
jgi:hypothetical protein